VVNRFESAELVCATLRALGVTTKCANETPPVEHPAFAFGALKSGDGVELLNNVSPSANDLYTTIDADWHIRNLKYYSF
jgi:hypothetical protein